VVPASTESPPATGTRTGPTTDGDARVEPAARLRGTLELPGDKSVTHRALLLAGLAAGRSTNGAASDGADCRSTAACLRQLGVDVTRVSRDGGGRVDWVVESAGRDGWREPSGPLDCGNSGTTLRMLAGILAGTPGYAVLDGDASLRERPVARIIEPLRRMGATLHARSSDTRPPLTVIGRRPLSAVEHQTAVPSAQVKSAVLLAGLSADGATTVRESVATRDHTERMLRARGVCVETREVPDGGVVVSVEGGTSVRALDQTIPADLSAAAFWLVAGAVHPDADISLPSVGVNPTRRAVIDLLRAMGARIDERPLEDAGGEPLADLRVTSSQLTGVDVSPAEVARSIDEIPALAVAAAMASGTSRFRGAGELRRKESDRLEGIRAGLASFGVDASIEGDDLVVQGLGHGAALRAPGARLDTAGDHRLVMAFSIAGLVARDATVVAEPTAAAVSYPGFFDHLERVRA
jgi:3-phosphoshikimate 1-carboxyvinyltransferase